MSLKIQSLPVSETNYAETMKTSVEPYLESVRKDQYFNGFDGKNIHYEEYMIPDSEAVIVIVHGFTESAEKFRETVYNFIQMGFSVFAIDNRGHGKSFRYNPNEPQVVTIRKFTDYVEDLNCFIKNVVKPASGNLPLYLYAHSMGGAIAVQYLQTYPDIFDKAVLSAPMIEAKMPIPPAVTLAMTRAFILFGKQDSKVFVHKGFDPNYSYENSNDTSKARFDYYHAKRLADPLLQTSAASYRWVQEAALVTKKNLDPERCSRIKCPVLVCQPAEDKSVVSEREDEFVKLLPNGKLEKFPDSRHEIYASVDSALLIYLQTIESFLKS